MKSTRTGFAVMLFLCSVFQAQAVFASSVLIHFVGLVVWTTERADVPVSQTTTTAFPNARLAPITVRPERVVAIMPCIGCRILNNRTPSVPLPSNAAILSRERAAGIGAVQPPAAYSQTPQAVAEPPSPLHLMVERHTAMIAFPKEYSATWTGWTPGVLGKWRYIQLTGERITFEAAGSNKVPVIPSTLEGHLGGTLQSDFRPPSYSDAAAVFEIPAGELSACVSRALDVSDANGGRRDVELQLNQAPGGTLTIRGGGNKSLTLTNLPVQGAEIYAADVPIGYATAHLDSGDPADAMTNHYYAYCWMNGTESNCTAPSYSSSLPGCQGNAMKRDALASPPPPLSRVGAPLRLSPQKTMSTDWECSNSQYP